MTNEPRTTESLSSTIGSSDLKESRDCWAGYRRPSQITKMSRMCSPHSAERAGLPKMHMDGRNAFRNYLGWKRQQPVLQRRQPQRPPIRHPQAGGSSTPCQAGHLPLLPVDKVGPAKGPSRASTQRVIEPGLRLSGGGGTRPCAPAWLVMLPAPASLCANLARAIGPYSTGSSTSDRWTPGAGL